jgi:hypothetical protein
MKEEETMIKVYIFVTGLVLYQFAATPGGTNYAILASGHFDFPGLAHIGKHEITVQAGSDGHPVPFGVPLEAELSVNCPAGGCPPIKEPEAIPSLVDLLVGDHVVPVVRSKCAQLGESANCHPSGIPTVPGRNGLLAFTGNWSAEALSDCGGSTYPYQLGPFVDMNFVRAGRAWELRFKDPEKTLRAVNAVLFTTMVEKMDDLQISNNQLKAELDPAKFPNCEGLRGFKNSGATKCAVVLIRNGSQDKNLGGGDLHYAALHALLENPLDAANLWLPLVSREDVCGGGGGTGGLSHCTGARLPRK